MDNDDLTIALCSIVVGLLILDRRTHGFLVGWGRVIHDMIVHRHVFVWGPCVLATLYHQMYDIVYLRQRSINTIAIGVGMGAYSHCSTSYICGY